LDSTTIDACLSVFPWAPFRSTKAAVKMHTLLDLRGNIPLFIFISDGKMHDVSILDALLPEAGAFYIMDRGYLDFERPARQDDGASFFVTHVASPASKPGACAAQNGYPWQSMGFVGDNRRLWPLCYDRH
jgi:hypothetical protein